MQWLTFVFVELQIPARALLPSRSVRERGLQSLLLCRYPCNYLRACYIEQLHFRNMRRCLSAYRYLHFGRGLIFLFLVVLYRDGKKLFDVMRFIEQFDTKAFEFETCFGIGTFLRQRFETHGQML